MRLEAFKNSIRLGKINKEVRQQLQLLPYITRCKMCGKKFLFMDYAPPGNVQLVHYVKKNKLCFECGFWQFYIEHQSEHTQVTNGVCYKLMPYVETPLISSFLGGNGKKRYFMLKDKTFVISNDVWKIGTIPERFREQLPDSGWFCNEYVYKRLTKFDGRCQERGCLDRYKCIRFRTELELEYGPFNAVPEDWQDGGERCRDFINIDNIENYQSPIKPIRK